MRNPHPLIRLALLVGLSLPSAALAQSAARVDELAATTQSLLDAHARIAADSGIRPESTPGYGDARTQLDEGRRLAATGDAAGARRTLQQAYEAATRLIVADRSGQKLATSRADQYAVKPAADRDLALAQARIEAVHALLDAYTRIAPEKGGINVAARDEVTRRLEMAQAAAVTGRTRDARTEAEAAYATISALVMGVRQGDRLVKTLAFDSPADEYHYEQDRFASYKMLLTLALAEQGKEAPPLPAETQGLAVQADEAARAGRWPEAIRLMEKATATLVQAIRATGRFIPS